MTIPGYWASRLADTPPRNKPSASAYTGASSGAHVCLKQITRPVTRPTMSPPMAHGIALPGSASSPANVLDHVKQAEPIAKSNRKSVFWAVPLTVMTSAGDCSVATSLR